MAWLARVSSSPVLLEHVAALAEVEADDPHRLRHRDDRVAGLPGDPLRGAVPGAGLLGRDRRVGHQVGGGPQDPRRRRWSARPRRPSCTARAAGSPRTRRRSGKPPVHSVSTTRSQPSTISAPVLPRRMRSSPSRSQVPGRDRGEDAAQRLVVLGRGHGRVSSAGRGLSESLRSRRPPVNRAQRRDGASLGRVAARQVRRRTRSAPRRSWRPGRRGCPRRARRERLAGVRGRDQRGREAEPGRLGQPAAERRHPAHVAGQRDLADRAHRRRDRRSSRTAEASASAIAEVGGRLAGRDAADGGDVDLVVVRAAARRAGPARRAASPPGRRRGR